MTTPKRIRASEAIDDAITDAETERLRLPGSNAERLKRLRENAKGLCGEYFARVAALGRPAPSCPGCEARELDPQPKQTRGGRR
jgi:hypothetical protein